MYFIKFKNGKVSAESILRLLKRDVQRLKTTESAKQGSFE